MGDLMSKKNDKRRSSHNCVSGAQKWEPPSPLIPIVNVFPSRVFFRSFSHCPSFVSWQVTQDIHCHNFSFMSYLIVIA